MAKMKRKEKTKSKNKSKIKQRHTKDQSKNEPETINRMSEAVDKVAQLKEEKRETNPYAIFDHENSLHEKNQLRLAKLLSDHILKNDKQLQKKKKYKNDPEKFFKKKFVKWCRSNKGQAQEYATEYLSNYIVVKTNEKMKNMDQYVGYHLSAWDRTGEVTVTDTLKDHIKELSRDVWSQGIAKKNAEYKKNKVAAVSLLEEKWTDTTSSLSSMHPKKFKEVLKEMIENKDTQCQSIAANTFKRISALCSDDKARKKNDHEIYAQQLKTEAFWCYGSQLGIRSGHILTSPLSYFKMIDGYEGLFQFFENKKNGNKGGYVRECLTRIVPHKHPEQCGIIKLAFYMYFMAVIMDDVPETPFEWGHHGKNRILNARVHMTAVLEALAYLNGMKDGLGPKKLHVLRSLCVNKMISAGTIKSERDDHLGWSTTVEAVHYASQEVISKSSRVAFLLAGRKSKDDPPHALWGAVEECPDSLIPDSMRNDTLLVYLAKVAITALAAGFGGEYFKQLLLKSLDDKDDFDKLRTTVGKLISDDDLNKTKKRKLQDYKLENAQLQAELAHYKKPRKEKEHTVQDLEDVFQRIVTIAKDPDFLDKAMKIFTVEIVPIIDQVSKNDNFGQNLSKGFGKSFKKLLILIAAVKRHGAIKSLQRENEKQSWLAWSYKNQYKNDSLRKIRVEFWSQYKRDYNFN